MDRSVTRSVWSSGGSSFRSNVNVLLPSLRRTRSMVRASFNASAGPTRNLSRPELPRPSRRPSQGNLLERWHDIQLRRTRRAIRSSGHGHPGQRFVTLFRVRLKIEWDARKMTELRERISPPCPTCPFLRTEVWVESPDFFDRSPAAERPDHVPCKCSRISPTTRVRGRRVASTSLYRAHHGASTPPPSLIAVFAREAWKTRCCCLLGTGGAIVTLAVVLHPPSRSTGRRGSSFTSPTTGAGPSRSTPRRTSSRPSRSSVERRFDPVRASTCRTCGQRICQQRSASKSPAVVFIDISYDHPTACRRRGRGHDLMEEGLKTLRTSACGLD